MRRLLSMGLPLVVAGILCGCDGRTDKDPAAEAGSGMVATGSGEYLLPLPPPPALSPERVALGRALFHEPRLSHDNSIACASCHALDKGGVDRRRVSLGIGGSVGPINAPTVFNAGLNVAQFWNGRAKTLEEQAAGPIQNPLEMGSNWNEVIAKLRADTNYVAQFRRVYADGITPANITDAIATFERSLVTPNSRFDRYLRGEKGALGLDAEKGYRRFISHGCASCHQGVGIGGNMFQKFGVMDDYFKGRAPSDADLGRFRVTGLDEDRFVFKVPSLRNIALTPPYFHDGSAATLDEAVRVMGQYQLGKKLSDEDVGLIVAFLRSLTGEWEGRELQ